MLVVGVLGYLTVSGVALWCGKKGNAVCKQLGEVLCCCIFAPIAIYECCTKNKVDDEEPQEVRDNSDGEVNPDQNTDV